MQPPGSRGANGNAPTVAPANHAEEERAIRASDEAFAEAFRKKDAKAIADLYTDDGEAVGLDGTTIQGRAALEEHYAARFAETPDEKLESTIESIKFLAPGIARETGRTRSVTTDGGTATTGRYTVIRIKRDGRWLIAGVRELADTEISHYERLKELEWLVGDWVEETEEALVFTSVAWADDKNFLLRTFDVRVKGKPALTGTQRIGWDPLTKQIKSWVFDSRGGYGDGLWMRSGNQWVVKATGVRPDGRTATATQVLTYVNKDTLRWKSIDRTVGDEIVGEIDEVVMVRKPPQPK
ncbi:MAG: SgcJ/EcaC family oxidoreductase [Isosphaeraceae bacterium]